MARRAVRLLVLMWLAVVPAVQAQPSDVPQVTRTFALENARVVIAPGRVLDRATVVVRDGLIAAVGPDVTVPFDAERIAADSLTVYAGFIDGLSHAGIPEPKYDDDERVEDNGNPPPARAGIQPQRKASALLADDSKGLQALREAGFTAAHVVPHGQMLPGTGAVILLADADDTRALVLRDDASLFARLEGSRGSYMTAVYPSTTMAVIATMRQLFREAERRQRLEALYAQNPAGLERPAFDPVHTALYPTVSGDRPVFFEANDALAIHRTLGLHDELGFPLVLVGLGQSYLAVDALREAGVPLLLTLDLPQEKDEKDDADSTAAASDSTKAMTPDDPDSFFISDLRTRSYADVEAETENLKARQTVERKKYYATAATLHEAGLRFGFSTLDAKPADLLKNVRTMVANGLPEETALAALTTEGAAVLGLQQSLGTIERGKIANLVVADGPIFDEETKLRYVFVDGHKYEIEAEKTGEPDPNVAPTGVWSYEVESTQGTITGLITLRGTPGDLSGTITSTISEGETDLQNLVLDGSTLRFDFDGGQFGRIEAEITIDGDTFSGTLTTANGDTVPIDGTRTSPGF